MGKDLCTLFSKYHCHLVDFQVAPICMTNYKERMSRDAWQSEKRHRSHRRMDGWSSSPRTAFVFAS